MRSTSDIRRALCYSTTFSLRSRARIGAVLTMLAAPSALAQWSGGPTGPIYYNQGNVGIGTTTPEAKLHVNGMGAPASNAWNIWTIVRFGDAGQNSNSAVLFDTGATGATALRGFYTAKNSQDFHVARFDSTAAAAPAIDLSILANGNVGMGVMAPQYKLAVNGTIGAKEVIVTNTGWADYVLAPGYVLAPLTDLEAFIKQNHRLPDMPSQADVTANGVDLGQMQVRLLAKIEELTLHVIRLDRENLGLRTELSELKHAAVLNRDQ